MSKLDWSLYVLTDTFLARGRPLPDVVRAAMAGGATAIQLREKGMTTRELVEAGRAVREFTREAGVTFIVNDRVDVALAVEADGVHLGQDDLPAPLARKLMGPHKIVGVSAGSVAEAQRAEVEGADYLGVGSVYHTGTKADAGPPIGVASLKEIVSAVTIPVVAIGGIHAENVAAVIQAGAAGAAVVSVVVAAEDVEAAARELRQRIEAARREGCG
ncbi:MAG: thiamine phosphate synthase [Anaerolineae bacterium]